MEIKINSLQDSLTVRENGGFMEISIKQDRDLCVMFFSKKDAKLIGEKLMKWADKKEKPKTLKESTLNQTKKW